jgi:hypothetical protein
MAPSRSTTPVAASDSAGLVTLVLRAILNKTLWHLAYSVVLSGLSVEETRVEVTSGSILYRHGRHGAMRTFP